MPFTFSHPALVLPLINKHWKFFSATGLIVGSVIPDFEAFIRLNVNKPHSHTWPGMFWFDLPLAVIAAYVFHNIVRDPLIRSLPYQLRGKFIRFVGYRWNEAFRNNFVPIIVSMLIGIFSHLVWDACTHLNFRYPGINASKTLVFNTQLHAILQDWSSVIGLIVVVWFVVRLPNDYDGRLEYDETDTHGAGKERLLYWAMLALFSGFILLGLYDHFRHPINIILKIDITIAAMMYGLLTTSLAHQVFYRLK